MQDIDFNVFGENLSEGIYSAATRLNIKNSSIKVLGSRMAFFGIRMEEIFRPSIIENTDVSSQSMGICLTDKVISPNLPALMTSRRSTVSGESGSIFGDATAMFNVAQSTLIGSAGGAGNTALKTCVASDNGSGVALTASCQ